MRNTFWRKGNVGLVVKSYKDVYNVKMLINVLNVRQAHLSITKVHVNYVLMFSIDASNANQLINAQNVSIIISLQPKANAKPAPFSSNTA